MRTLKEVCGRASYEAIIVTLTIAGLFDTLNGIAAHRWMEVAQTVGMFAVLFLIFAISNRKSSKTKGDTSQPS